MDLESQSREQLLAELQQAREENQRLRAGEGECRAGLQGDFTQELINQLPGALAFVDRELVFKLVNPLWARLFDRTPADFIGKNVFDVFPGTEAQVADRLRQVLESGEPFQAFSFPFVWPDTQGPRESFWDLNWNPLRNQRGEVTGLLALAFEVTPRVRLEQALASQKELTRSIVDNAPMAIAFVDPSTVTRWVNPTFARLMGLPAERIVGRRFRELVPAENALELERVYRRLADTKQEYSGKGLPLELERDGKKETTYWDYTWLPVMDDDCETLAGVITLAVEVTERIEKERWQAEQIERLQAVDRLKSNFINAASHELRTPLTSILGFAEFLEEQVSGPLSPEQCGFVEQIKANTSRLQYLVDDLLDFARLEAGTLELQIKWEDLRALIERELASLAPMAHDKRVALTTELPDAPLWVRMDERRIGQVLLNLVGNALKFTPAGCQILVRLHRREQEACLEVADTGIGIAPEHLPRLFEKFYQVDQNTNRHHGGTGLGLAISRSIVEAHGGSIDVESTPGKGSTFWFVLPYEGPGRGTEEKG